MRAALAAGLTALLLLAAGCGDDDTEPAAGGGNGGGGDDAATPQVSKECQAAFPLAFEEPDLADVALLPDGFPEPPVDATLCLTSETVGGGTETASYATDASEEEILAGYESALASYAAVREDDGIGRSIINATAGDVYVQVTPQEGGFVIAFAQE